MSCSCESEALGKMMWACSCGRPRIEPLTKRGTKAKASSGMDLGR